MPHTSRQAKRERAIRRKCENPKSGVLMVGKPRAGFPKRTKSGAQVHSLGRVYNGAKFHTKTYIYPVGFRSTRQFPSIKDPTRKKTITYISTILDTGDGSPTFRVTPAHYPKEAVEAKTPSTAWAKMLRVIRNRPKLTASGPDMFGFYDPSIKEEIEGLEGASKCAGYTKFAQRK